MQTFLPYSDFRASAACLDYRRLGKQRIEAMQIYQIITGQATSNAWKNHPAVLMWEGYENCLASYYNTCVLEWVYERKYKHTMGLLPCEGLDVPPWLGDKQFHSTHRAALLAKNFEWYSQFKWTEEPVINYYWPIRLKETNEN